ncbi:MAG TPA: tetratricopeptide repeat protein [Rhizomicrobium sp.]|nr:tetratricopeptide repeat protein [Rhizomicrobium sp.]
MSNSGTLSIDVLLQQAIASHKAGQRAAAAKAYQAVIGVEPGHVEANHNLGVLMIQAGRIEEGLAHLARALKENDRQALHYLSYARGLLAAGKPKEAEAVLDQGRRCGLADGRFDALQQQIEVQAGSPDDPIFLDNRGSALLAEGKVADAIQSYRKALAIAPDFADAHYHLGWILSENGHVAEGFAHYMRRAALMYGTGKAPPTDQPDPPYKVKHDSEQRDYLAGGKASPDAPQVRDMFQLADGSRVDGPAVNPANATPELLDQWQSAWPQMVVMEDFLTQAALTKLRAYCAGSTIWRKLYSAGYLGAAPEDGFACPLLAQIVEEIQSTFRPILRDEPFQYLGAFKYDSALCAGTNTHADNSAINVNFYIAPDDANLDPEHGGMEIWDLAAPDVEAQRKYSSSESAVRDLLRSAGAKSTIIPHRSNRAVIFKSALFHKTDTFTFKTDYLSRRINISLLFGRLG